MSHLHHQLEERSRAAVAAGSSLDSYILIEDQHFQSEEFRDLNIDNIVLRNCTFGSVEFTRCTLNNVKFEACRILNQNTTVFQQCMGAGNGFGIALEPPAAKLLWDEHTPLMERCLFGSTSVHLPLDCSEMFVASDSMLPALSCFPITAKRFVFSRSCVPDHEFRNRISNFEGLEPAPSLSGIFGVSRYDKYRDFSPSAKELMKNMSSKYGMPALYDIIKHLTLAGKWSAKCSDDPEKFNPAMCARYLTEQVGKITSQHRFSPPNLPVEAFTSAVVSVIMQQLAMYQHLCLGAES